MSTDTQNSRPAPEFTVFTRVTTIPFVQDSITYVDQTLSSNSLLRSPYATGKALTSTALDMSKPLVPYLAPIISRADGLANQGIDVVEKRYPYPFQTPTEKIAGDIKAQADYARTVANKTVEERVINPVHTVVNGVDQRLTPLVDYLASTLARLNEQVGNAEQRAAANGQAASDEAKYQYQRAYLITKDLRDQLYVYSTEQLKQLEQQSVIIQRASQTAQSITQLASSSIDTAQQRVQSLSDTMVQELKKVQSSTAALPAHLQSAFQPVQQTLSATIHDLSDVIKSDASLNDKVNRVSATVRERVTPVLDAAADAIRSVLQRAETSTNVATNGAANGSAH
ncbi:hypothetical protein K488DRAFT_73136 [Vararia minispora EC-137]|uniref:Uncharacterized protein n=1 Tax=Vararia minispora EC-137 TaxID=1314806 RepID=A0ACB8QBW0_9AGAM|nr:hypothetical protein K488DRAFT_73136 [Vararia minispora EC-137]